MLTLALALFAAAPTGGTAVLLRGEIETAKPISTEQGDEATVGSLTLISLRIRRIVAGNWTGDRKRLQTTIPMASLPRAKGLREVYLLLEQRQDGWQPIHWSYAKSGICIPDDYASQHGLDARLPDLKVKAIVVCH